MSFDVIVLSPHLDDAALSCGGILHRWSREGGRKILVVNVFAAAVPDDAELSDSLKRLHATWRQAGRFSGPVMAHRRREEEAACDRLGVDVHFLDYLDAAYRRNGQGRLLYDPVASVMGRRHAADAPLVDELTATFRKLPSATRWLVPMGIGHHVDHLLVRDAAEGLRRRDLRYYEDYPYARSRWLGLKARMGHLGRWRRDLRPLRPLDVEAKIEAIACHRSQLRGVVADDADLARQVRTFSRGGEKLWRLR